MDGLKAVRTKGASDGAAKQWDYGYVSLLTSEERRVYTLAYQAAYELQTTGQGNLFALVA